MKEIGGYFGLEQLVDNEYHKHLLRLNTGRNALLYLVRAKGIRKTFIPFYLCDSVSNMLRQNNCDFEYYHIDEHFNPVFNRVLGEDEYLYVVNYYGQLDNRKIASLKERYKRIIVDNTQAFFKKPIKGVDTLYSCRKFFGVPDGAYLSTDCILDEDLDISISKDKMIHILGRYEGTAFDYYTSFQENDASFRSEPLKFMSRLTQNILGAIDYEDVIESRNRNFAYLRDSLGCSNILDIKTPYGPFTYPYYVENGIEVRRRLAEVKIYIPTLWPNVLKGLDKRSIEYNYAANILPLPCDQRYGTEEMEYIADSIMEVLKCLRT